MPIFIILVLSVVVSAIGLKYLKTPWVYFLVTSLLPPMLMIGADAVWHGGLDAWDDIVFVVLALIAFGVSLMVRFAWPRKKQERKPPSSASQD